MFEFFQFKTRIAFNFKNLIFLLNAYCALDWAELESLGAGEGLHKVVRKRSKEGDGLSCSPHGSHFLNFGELRV